MKIHTDKHNFQFFKLFITSLFDGNDPVIITHSFEDKVLPYFKTPRFPLLELDNGDFLFSPNQGARFMRHKNGKELPSPSVDTWLEWESIVFMPYLFNYLVNTVGHKKKDKENEVKILSNLKYLESKIGDKFIATDSLSVADIVIWSSLFPLYVDKSSLQGTVKADFPKITSWFNSLSQLPAFQKATSDIKDITVFKESLLAQPLPSIPKAVDVSQSSNEPDEITQAEKDNVEKTWATGLEKQQKPRPQKHPKEPEAGTRNVLITSALPYVNNVPHLGNIIGCVLSADVFSRYCRLKNYNTLYICGTDEYGTATETKALEEGSTPQQICDKYNKLHADIYKWFNIDFDHFGRTSTEQQTKIAQDMFWKLHKNGYIIRDTVEQLKCEKCERFLADRFVEGICPMCKFDDARGDQCDKCGKLINAVELIKPRCKTCATPPVVKTSEHLFLDLPKLEPDLEKWLESAFEKGLWTTNAKNITRAWLKDGLKPRCITRDLKWGTQVPLEGFTDKVFYVWFDAPIGYLSITANYTKDWEKWWKSSKDVELFQFMAKDNVPFHSVVFPCSQIGTRDNFNLVNHLVATEYLNYENDKFSKSRGSGVFGDDAADTGIEADIWRFYLLYMRPESQDSSFSWDDLILKNNSELLANLGNFINRALMFVANSFKGLMPEVNLNDEDKDIIALVNRELQQYTQHFENVRLKEGIKTILNISRIGNQYIQANKPWELVKKDDSDKARAGTVISLATNLSCLLSILIQPYMPTVSNTIQDQLKAPASLYVIPDNFVLLLKAGHKIGKPKPLFAKIETEKAEELKKRYAGKQKPTNANTATKKPENPPAAAAASVTSPAAGDAAKIESLTTEVAKQGDAVRNLKAAKAEKAKIDEAVAKLLDLKKQLALAQGIDPATVSGEISGGGGKKNKKKK